MRKSWNYLLIAMLGLMSLIAAFLFERSTGYSLQGIAEETGMVLENKLTRSETSLTSLFTEGLDSAWEVPSRSYESERIGLYVFRNDSIKFWNNSQIPLTAKPSFFTRSFGFIKMEQGYYLYARKDSLGLKGIALSLVKPTYALENNYLKNDFLGWTGIPAEIRLDTSKISVAQVVVRGENLFSLKGNEEIYHKVASGETGMMLFLLAYILLLSSCLIYASSRNPGLIGFVMLLTLILGFRLLMIYFKWPVFIYRSSLYDLQLFGNAQSFFNGFLGDILLNALALTSIAFLCYFYFSASAKNSFLELVASFILCFFIVQQFNQTAISLIRNSTLSFDFLAIFNIKPQVFVGLAALGFYSMGLFVVVYRVCHYFNGKDLMRFFKASLFFGVICILEHFFYRETHFESYWLLFYALSLYLLFNSANVNSSLGLGIQIVIIAFIASRIFMTHIRENQQKDLDILSFELSERQDDILENEFAGVPAKIMADKELGNLLNILKDVPDAGSEIGQLIKQKYFSGYFDRYSIDFSLFDRDCHPLLPVKQAVTLNEGFFEDQINNYGDSSFVENLYLIKNVKKNSQYIGKIQLNDLKLYVLMEPKQYEELGSFPDLLL
ncbi:MAG: hypothetical protein JNL60_12105, partial [Bacteroidia bacterium]|nr:hypothetical protein [Bacteroidia bacterium]